MQNFCCKHMMTLKCNNGLVHWKHNAIKQEQKVVHKHCQHRHKKMNLNDDHSLLWRKSKHLCLWIKNGVWFYFSYNAYFFGLVYFIFKYCNVFLIFECNIVAKLYWRIMIVLPFCSFISHNLSYIDSWFLNIWTCLY